MTSLFVLLHLCGCHRSRVDLIWSTRPVQLWWINERFASTFDTHLLYHLRPLSLRQLVRFPSGSFAVTGAADCRNFCRRPLDFRLGVSYPDCDLLRVSPLSTRNGLKKSKTYLVAVMYLSFLSSRTHKCGWVIWLTCAAVGLGWEKTKWIRRSMVLCSEWATARYAAVFAW